MVPQMLEKKTEEGEGGVMSGEVRFPNALACLRVGRMTGLYPGIPGIEILRSILAKKIIESGENCT